MSSFLLFSKHWTRASFLCAWHLARSWECCGEWNIRGLSPLGPGDDYPVCSSLAADFYLVPQRDLMSIHCHLMREPLHLRDTRLHRKPLVSHSLVRTRIPSSEGLTVLFSGTIRALAFVGSDTLLLRFFYRRGIRTAFNNFFHIKKTYSISLIVIVIIIGTSL